MTTGRNVAESFEHGVKANAGNYSTDGKSYFLFGVKIAERREDGIYFSNAGYLTVTTSKALNFLRGLAYHTKQGQAFNHGLKIDSDVFYKVRDTKFLEAMN